VTVGGIRTYSVGPTSSSLAVVYVYDIFGEHLNTLQTADTLSAALNARVVLPDYFDGEPYPIEKFPIKDFAELMAYLNKKAGWDKCNEYTLKVYEGLKAEGHKHIGTWGACWGAKVGLSVANTPQFEAGHVFVHPSFFKVEDASAVKAPVLLLPSKEEIDLLPFLELLKQSSPEVSKKSDHHRFDDMHHGFCGSRCDWKNELNAKRATEAIALATKFYENNVQ